MRVAVDSTGHPSIAGVWTLGGAAGSALVANNVLYYATSRAVHALDPTTGHSLWSGTTAGGIHWQSPVVANGVLYIVDDGQHLTAFALPGVNDAGAPDGGAEDATADAKPGRRRGQ
jgi:outer membrane protein assembly factor BamB